MPINMWQVNQSASQFRKCAADVAAAAGRLSGFQGAVNGAWQGPELPYINGSVEQTKAELRRVSADLNALANEITGAAMTIKRAEDAATAQRARDAAAAAQRARSTGGGI